MKGLVPDWTRLPLTQARLTSDILDVLLLQRYNLSVPVDHGDMPSINLTSRPLRQVMYGLLLGKRRHMEVNERDRDGLQLKVIPVKPAVRGVARQLTPDSLDQVKLLGFIQSIQYCSNTVLMTVNVHHVLVTLSLVHVDPGGVLPASAGLTGRSRCNRGLSEPPATSVAPPGGRHLLLAAESSALPRPKSAEGAAAGTE